jgi:hypothetical protein
MSPNKGVYEYVAVFVDDQRNKGKMGFGNKMVRGPFKSKGRFISDFL